ncbi:MAG: hypothetical protein AB1611_13515 [bacterium]
METGISKSQGIKVAVLGAVLLVVLILNGRIKNRISAWRMRLQGTKVQNTSSAGREENGSPMSEISRILSEKLNIPPLEKILKANQELPATVERDIFRFQPAGNLRQTATNAAAEGPPRKPESESAASRENPPGLKLEATLTGGSPLAVINNQPLKPGQSIMGYYLREVRDKQALLSRNGQDIILTLDQEER